ncbi:MAG: LysR family transcriptional regulator, partial [Candidatus Limiplasma sp.]|nr:LysR family transcriptional regulator [Candidatus Limiplasma sp.]
MYFDYYDYFYKVAYLGNITKAANEIHISQSALSKAILKLEKSLDCQLFYRIPKGVKLTPAGEVLYEGVKKSIALMASTNQQI